MRLIAVTGWGQARDRGLTREAGFDFLAAEDAAVLAVGVARVGQAGVVPGPHDLRGPPPGGASTARVSRVHTPSQSC